MLEVSLMEVDCALTQLALESLLLGNLVQPDHWRLTDAVKDVWEDGSSR